MYLFLNFEKQRVNIGEKMRDLKTLEGKKIVVNNKVRGTLKEVKGDYIVVEKEEGGEIIIFRRGITRIEVVQ